MLSIDSKFDFVSWIGHLRGNTVRINTRGRQHELSSLESSFERAVHNMQRDEVAARAPAPAFTKNAPMLAMA